VLDQFGLLGIPPAQQLSGPALRSVPPASGGIDHHLAS
jgi:hypothetical protein